MIFPKILEWEPSFCHIYPHLHTFTQVFAQKPKKKIHLDLEGNPQEDLDLDFSQWFQITSCAKIFEKLMTS